MGLILATVKENAGLTAPDAESDDIVATLTVGQPFHALSTLDGATMLLALANGYVPKIDLASATIVEGGFHVGGLMPEALIYRDL